MAQKRSDKANYLALAVVGIALLLFGVWPLAIPALIGAGIYYWKVEKTEAPAAPQPDSQSAE